jgi:hypothetical protein
MSEPSILSREVIAADAQVAAQRYAEHGVEQVNPWPTDSDAALAWAASYERCKQQLVPECEASA